jgi:hypothetical protein
MQKNILGILGFAILFFLTGCDSSKIKTYPVTGKVTYKGEVVAGATVSFTAKDRGEGQGVDAYARTDNNGVYKLQTQEGKPEGGTTPGEYYVLVTKLGLKPTGRKSTDSTGVVTEETVPFSEIPEKYNATKQTPLSFTVDKKKNTYDIVIED